eukprot:2548630-Rhodomonas_salina.1
MMYAQFETLEDGSRRFCATMNAIPYRCTAIDLDLAFGPGEFLQAMEFTTEMLVTPIELTTTPLSRSEVQRKYYLSRVEMSKRLGPAAVGAGEQDQERQLMPFDTQVVLVAPPILWQTRQVRATCDDAKARP